MALMTSPGPPASQKRAGTLTPRSLSQFHRKGDMAPGSRELIALSLLAGLGFGLALARGDLFFAAVFGVASAMTIIGTIRCSR
jgi:hypothetical protein